MIKAKDAVKVARAALGAGAARRHPALSGPLLLHQSRRDRRKRRRDGRACGLDRAVRRRNSGRDAAGDQQPGCDPHLRTRRAYSRCAPGLPFSTRNEARVEIGESGCVT